MSLKINNKTLALVFILLLVIFVVFFLFDGGSERTFRSALVDIDSSAVTEILIHPASKSNNDVRIFKEGENWKVTLASGKTANADDRKINEIFFQLMSIKPERLAARGQDKWNEFQVDSTGTRVEVKEGSETTLDIILGRFAFQQPRTMNTYVRLANDTDVYEVPGFLSMTFNQGADSFRDATIIKDDYNNWQQLTFTYPADSSFQLINKGSQWMVNASPADSVKTANYLRRIANFNGSGFIDEPGINENTIPAYTLNITTKDLNFIEVKAYIDSTNYIIHSSKNPDVYFDGKTTGKNLFVGKSEFLSK